MRARLEQLLSMPTPEQVAEAQRARVDLVDFEVDHIPRRRARNGARLPSGHRTRRGLL